MQSNFNRGSFTKSWPLVKEAATWLPIEDTEIKLMSNKCLTRVDLNPNPSNLKQRQHRLLDNTKVIMYNAMSAPKNKNLSHTHSVLHVCPFLCLVLPHSLRAWYSISLLWSGNECLVFCSSVLKPYSCSISFTMH